GLRRHKAPAPHSACREGEWRFGDRPGAGEATPDIYKRRWQDLKLRNPVRGIAVLQAILRKQLNRHSSACDVIGSTGRGVLVFRHQKDAAANGRNTVD